MKPEDPKRRRRVRRWSCAAGLALAVLFGPGMVEWGRLNWQTRRLDRRLAELDQERARLTETRKRLETDPGYVEGLIRTTFKWAQDGELVIRMDEPKARPAR